VSDDEQGDKRLLEPAVSQSVSDAPGSTPQPGDGRFRLLVESILDYGIFMLDADGHIASWNAGAARMNGYTGPEIVGKHFSVFYPPEEVASGKCEMVLGATVERGRFEEEGWRIRKDGSRFWANVVITAVRGPDGRLLGFGKVTRDLTERRQAEKELRTSEERMRLLIASVKDYAIFVLDPTGHVASWNPGAERLKGYTAKEIIGQHFSRFYPAEDIRAGKCEMELAVAQQVGRFEDEGWRIRKDGSRFWANVVITPIRDDSGSLIGFAKVTRDLSERKRHDDERLTLARAEEARRAAEENQERLSALAHDLRLSRDKAEEATRLKDEFLATVGHELRTPLSAILGWSRMLQGGSMNPAKTTRAIDAIVRNAAAQSQIIDDLLDVSRIVAGQLRLDVDFIDISQTVNAGVDVVRAAAEAKGVTLQIAINPEAGVIRGDSGRVQQIVWNLVNNAVKFTPRGGRVTLSLRRTDASMEIEVADTGRGIVRDFLPHVFERFAQQEGSNSRKAGGLGLGLAIVKHLVELHGGTVEVHSAGENLGATFTVKLPLAPVRAPLQAAASGSSVLREEIVFPTELISLRVLVVDDEPDARQLLQSVLEAGGAKVRAAESAATAMAMIHAEKPDVIVSDIGMPEVDGYDFIRQLRQLSREDGGRIPAVALTAYARAEDRRKALVAGFQNHSSKPMDPQELVIVVANVVGRFA
jgi:PAS domain S-box-containing protein